MACTSKNSIALIMSGFWDGMPLPDLLIAATTEAANRRGMSLYWLVTGPEGYKAVQASIERNLPGLIIIELRTRVWRASGDTSREVLDAKRLATRLSTEYNLSCVVVRAHPAHFYPEGYRTHRPSVYGKDRQKVTKAIRRLLRRLQTSK